MGLFRKAFTCGALLALLAAMLIGAFMASIPSKMGFFQLVAAMNPVMVGMTPAFMRTADWQSTFHDIAKISLEGQTAVVTGANIGLGYYTSLHLARQGAAVFMCCRTPAKCQKAAEAIRANLTNAGSVTVVDMDTSSLKSVAAAAEDIQRQVTAVDMLVLNAGIGLNPFSLSEDGFESVLATNQIGHHLLFTLLKPLMSSGGKTGASRVVSVASAAHFDSYDWGVAVDRATMNSEALHDPARAYGQSKLANVLFAQEVSRRASLAGEPIFANALHPGAVDTNIWVQLRRMINLKLEIVPEACRPQFAEWFMAFIDKLRTEFMWTGEDGALTQIYLAASPMVKEQQIRGRYFHPQATEVLPNRLHAPNVSLQKQFYDFCDGLVAGFAK